MIDRIINYIQIVLKNSLRENGKKSRVVGFPRVGQKSSATCRQLALVKSPESPVYKTRDFLPFSRKPCISMAPTVSIDTSPNSTSIASLVCHAEGPIYVVAPAPTRNISPDVLKSR
jgi:hypothetical protein